QIEKLKKLVILFRNAVFSHVNLKTFSVLLEMREGRLTHTPDGLDTPRDANYNLRLQFLSRFRAVCFQNVRNGMGEVEAVAVGFIAERFDLSDAVYALLIQFIFQRQ